MKKYFLFLLLLSQVGYAQDTQVVGRQTKQTIGTLISVQDGDTACYLMLKDDKGKDFNEMADFSICEQESKLKGKRLRLTYAQSKVMAASCQGDVNCKKSDTVVLVTKASIENKAGNASSKTQTQTSFCTPMEVTVFSCKSGVKMASVCASKAHGTGKGYLQYRFGKFDSTEPLEMIWPEGEVSPDKAATGEYTPFAGGGGTHLRFNKGNISYIVYAGIGRWGPKGEALDKQGIAVERDGKLIASLKCSQLEDSEMGPNWFEKSGVKASSKEFIYP